MTQDNRQIRIFISSTFRDMNAERDYLITKVFPRLKAEAAKRDVTIIPLDLRWGVTEEESKTGKVIEICLDEIRNSRPFFIGLVGNRYGWCPDQTELTKNKRLAERYGWLSGDLKDGLSVTEIEMQYGVLRAQDRINAYFFLKDGGQDDEPEKLGHLRESILKNKRYPVGHYTQVEELGEQVAKAFLALLDELYPIESLSQLEKERQAQRSFVMSRTEVYIPNKAHYATLDKWLKGEERQLVVTGESGMGKSALIANWLMTHIDDQDRNFIFHFIGNGGEDGNKDAILARLTREVRDIYHLPTPEKEEGDAKTICEQTLAQIAGQKPLVIVLDAVNQLQEANNQKELTWLPMMPSNVKVLYSTLREDPTMKVFERLKYPVFVLKALDKKARKQLATDYLAYYSKHLTDKQIDRIINAPVVENTLVLRTLLDELIGFGSHEELDNRIAMYLAAKDTADFFRIVLERYETDFDKDLIAQILALIGFSRRGMAEDELKSITKANNLQFSQFYCAFRQNLMVRNGLLCFSHAHIANAVRARYKEREAESRKAIYGLLWNSDTHRAYEEVPWQYYQEGNWYKLHNYLSRNGDAFYYLDRAAEYELALYWRTLLAQDSEKYSFEACMEMVDEDKEEDATMAVFYYGYFASRLLNDFELGLKFKLRGLEIFNQLDKTDPDDLASAYDAIGDEYHNLADQEHTMEYYTKALEIREKVLADESKIAYSYLQLARLADDMGDKHKGLEMGQKAYDLYARTKGPKSLQAAYALGIMGDSLIGLQQLDKGEEYIRQSLEIVLSLQGENNESAAQLYSCLGDIAMMRPERDCEKSLYYHQKSLEINLRLLGEKHKRIASDYSNIGTAYLILNDERAIEYMQRCLDLRLAIYGEIHPETGRAYMQLGSAHARFNRWDKAIELYKKNLEICLATYGEEYGGTISAYHSIGLAYAQKHSFDKALEYIQKAYDLGVALLGADHPYNQTKKKLITTIKALRFTNKVTSFFGGGKK